MRFLLGQGRRHQSCRWPRTPKGICARPRNNAVSSSPDLKKAGCLPRLPHMTNRQNPRGYSLRLGQGAAANANITTIIVTIVVRSSLMAIPKRTNAVREKRLEGSFASVPTDRQPLTPWEKYAHALLQANEAIFVN